jgi:hypothetical protein
MNKNVMIIGGIALAGVITAIVLSKRGTEGATGKGYIAVNTVPANATVLINGTSVGLSPNTFEVNPGTYTVLIQLNGYYDVTTTVTVGVGETKTCDITLTPVSSGGEWQPMDVQWT